jgi:hypothetical protein
MGCDFVINAGDAFYEKGLQTSSDAQVQVLSLSDYASALLFIWRSVWGVV